MYRYFILLLLFSRGNLNEQTDFWHIDWEKEKIAPGLNWKYSHTRFNDSVMQNINMLSVRLTKRKRTAPIMKEKELWRI